jgi:hypothetical protein
MGDDLKAWVQDTLWPEAGFTPCPYNTPCGNCDHPLRGHFQETPNSYATACRECPCQHWYCKHGGMRT